MSNISFQERVVTPVEAPAFVAPQKPQAGNEIAPTGIFDRAVGAVRGSATAMLLAASAAMSGIQVEAGAAEGLGIKSQPATATERYAAHLPSQVPLTPEQERISTILAKAITGNDTERSKAKNILEINKEGSVTGHTAFIIRLDSNMNPLPSREGAIEDYTRTGNLQANATHLLVGSHDTSVGTFGRIINIETFEVLMCFDSNKGFDGQTRNEVIFSQHPHVEKEFAGNDVKNRITKLADDMMTSLTVVE